MYKLIKAKVPMDLNDVRDLFFSHAYSRPYAPQTGQRYYDFNEPSANASARRRQRSRQFVSMWWMPGGDKPRGSNRGTHAGNIVAVREEHAE